MIGIWIKWPGFWVKLDGEPMTFDTVAEAQEFADTQDMDMDMVEIKTLD